MPLEYARQAPFTTAFSNAVTPGFLSDSGRTDYLPANNWMLSTGHGCQWMVV